ncbi:MAG: hypothetical protein CVT64_07830 [Actinobacteria bacterium HGW-Actinobacteria-4]|nr:MAG: hypothetical protein CVT64_07830 [Actinobacteria bacterium HGW-Actinobacteria-4]
MTASPLYRAWVATALMAALFAMLFIPSLFLLRVFANPTEGFADLAYVVVALFAYAITVVVLIPATAHTLGRYIDRRTSTWPDLKAAMLFAGVAAMIGSLVAVPLTLDSGMGPLPFINYMLVPGLAAFGTRMLLPVALRVTAVRVSAIVIATAAAGVLAVLAIWNLTQNVA